jgi:hypothetical protein
MIFSMNLISESLIDNIIIKYYEGIDINILYNHPNDGTDGILVCFIENLKSEIRNQKINSVIFNDNYVEFSEINNNNYLIIYQYSNIPMMKLYEIIKEKLEKGYNPWIPIVGIKR